MATATFSIEYRPVRVGFVVRDGNVGDLIPRSRTEYHAVGGMYNPILPARDRSPLPEYLMDAFQLDVLLPAIEKEAELVHYVERFRISRSCPAITHC